MPSIDTGRKREIAGALEGSKLTTMNRAQLRFFSNARRARRHLDFLLRTALCSMIGVFTGGVALGQGTIEFSNLNAPFLDESGAPLTGTNYLAQLYAGDTADALIPIGAPVSFLTDKPGYFRSVVSIPFAPYGAATWVQVRAWDATAGPTFEQAHDAGAWTAFSNTLFLNTGGGGSPPIAPATLVGLRFLGSGRLPRIEAQPSSQTVERGLEARFAVVAVNGPLSYQWRRAHTALPGETNAALTIANVTPSRSGNYDVVVTNPSGIQISQSCILTVNILPGSPVIIRQPLNEQERIGESISLSVVSTGESPLLYQWYEGASGDTRSPISGATNSNYVVRVSSNRVSVWVRVQNAVGVDDSESAVLAPDPGADPLNQWSWRNPIPQGNQLSSVTYGNGLFVAVGDAGTILTSPDGLSWTWRPSGTARHLNSVVYGANEFVAVGDAGTVLASVDGLSWSEQSIFKDFQLLGITFDQGVFVAVGESGVALISSNGFDWSSELTGRFHALTSVTFGNGLFVAAGGSILTSDDGSTWLSRVAGIHNPFSAVAFFGDRFLAIGVSNRVSVDGVVWNASSLDEISSFSGAAKGDGILVAVGPGGAIRSSVDGTAWSAQGSGTDESLRSVSHALGLFVAAGDRGVIVTSADGVEWTLRTSSVDVGNRAAFGGGTFVATAGPSLVTSQDGVIWTKRTLPNEERLNAVAHGNGTFVAVGERGIVLTSSDGIDWTRQLSGSSEWLSDVTYGNGTFLAFSEGAQPGILTSSNAVTWTSRGWGFGSLGELLGAAYGAGLFVAVGGLPGGLNSIVTSPDAEAWTARDSPRRSQLWSVTYGNGTFVAVGLGGTIVTSTNGIQWADRSMGLTRLFGVRYGNGYFVAVGENGTILTSRDGVDWIRRKSGTVDWLSGVAFGNGRFIVLGGGAILESALVDTPIRISAPRMIATGGFSFLVESEPWRVLTIQSSPDLVHWMPLTNLSVTSQSALVTAPSASNQSAGFYRISSDANVSVSTR